MRIGRVRPVEREVERFRANPASMRNATLIIITITVAAVVVGSLVMWLFDKRDFPDFGTAFWFVLQTVTTVGYGDVTPTSSLGRTVAGLVMIVAIAFLTIVTAMITSTFIDAAQRRRQADDTDAQRSRSDRVDARFDEILVRLAAIETALGIATSASDSGTSVGVDTKAPDATGAPADPPVPSP